MSNKIGSIVSNLQDVNMSSTFGPTDLSRASNAYDPDTPMSKSTIFNISLNNLNKKPGDLLYFEKYKEDLKTILKYPEEFKKYPDGVTIKNFYSCNDYNIKFDGKEENLCLSFEKKLNYEYNFYIDFELDFYNDFNRGDKDDLIYFLSKSKNGLDLDYSKRLWKEPYVVDYKHDIKIIEEGKNSYSFLLGEEDRVFCYVSPMISIYFDDGKLVCYEDISITCNESDREKVLSYLKENVGEVTNTDYGINIFREVDFDSKKVHMSELFKGDDVKQVVKFDGIIYYRKSSNNYFYQSKKFGKGDYSDIAEEFEKIDDIIEVPLDEVKEEKKSYEFKTYREFNYKLFEMMEEIENFYNLIIKCLEELKMSDERTVRKRR